MANWPVFFEAYFHSVTFTAVILAHVLFAIHCYLGIVRRKALSAQQVIILMTTFDITLLVGTACLAHFELAPIFLSPGGFYCFFDFRAPFTIFYWVPLFCLSFSAITLCYVLIYRHTAESTEQLTRGSVSQAPLVGTSTSRKLAKRAAYLLATLLAFLPMLISLCMTWFNREPPGVFVAFAGVCADFHGIVGPLVYALQNPRLDTFSKIPCLARFHSRRRTSSYSVNPTISNFRFQSTRATLLNSSLRPSIHAHAAPNLRRDTMPFDPAFLRQERFVDTSQPSCSRTGPSGDTTRSELSADSSHTIIDSRDISQENSHDIAQDNSQDTSQDNSQDTSQDNSQTISQDISQEEISSMQTRFSPESTTVFLPLTYSPPTTTVLVHQSNAPTAVTFEAQPGSISVSSEEHAPIPTIVIGKRVPKPELVLVEFEQDLDLLPEIPSSHSSIEDCASPVQRESVGPI